MHMITYKELLSETAPPDFTVVRGNIAFGKQHILGGINL